MNIREGHWFDFWSGSHNILQEWSVFDLSLSQFQKPCRSVMGSLGGLMIGNLMGVWHRHACVGHCLKFLWKADKGRLLNVVIRYHHWINAVRSLRRASNWGL